MAYWNYFVCLGFLLFFFPWEIFEKTPDLEKQQADHASAEEAFQAASERLMKAEMEKPPL
jgi:hypothetical protein